SLAGGYMKDSMKINSVSDSSLLEIIFPEGKIPKTASDYMEVRLNGSMLQSSVRVYDVHWQFFTNYFDDLATNWRGWDGRKEWKSIEDEMRLSCEIDKVGHVSLYVTLEDNM
ncbi:MAG TPA: DUF6228 family protein, partial [Ignavibacteriaceae bacterium]|nr:DUF6228 family protein [Ignavibacteriaceae bacterium]